MIARASFHLTNFQNLFFSYRFGISAYLLQFSPFISKVYTFFKTDYSSKNSKANIYSIFLAPSTLLEVRTFFRQKSFKWYQLLHGYGENLLGNFKICALNPSFSQYLHFYSTAVHHNKTAKA